MSSFDQEICFYLKNGRTALSKHAGKRAAVRVLAGPVASADNTVLVERPWGSPNLKKANLEAT